MGKPHLVMQLSLSLNISSVPGLYDASKTFQSTWHYCTVRTGSWQASSLQQTPNHLCCDRAVPLPLLIALPT